MNKLSYTASALLLSLCGACSSSPGSQVDALSSSSGAPGRDFQLVGSGGATRSVSQGQGAGTESLSCMPQADDTGCVGEQYAGETVPLDVYILFDESCSMSCPISQSGPGQCCIGGPDQRIVPVRAALDSFLQSPETAGIGFGL
jgi:hypothetical protein